MALQPDACLPADCHTHTQTPAPCLQRCPQYGGPQFLEQHDWITQLNLQAHHNAAAQSDEFVMEALVSRDKVDTLIHGLLAAEVSVWRACRRLLPANTVRMNACTHRACKHQQRRTQHRSCLNRRRRGGSTCTRCCGST